jgi:hypothetical protein
MKRGIRLLDSEWCGLPTLSSESASPDPRFGWVDDHHREFKEFREKNDSLISPISL